ncbi:MAG: hypothetical protein LBC69_01735 [Eubacteriaceae bacterium]|jgi:hypothetical protein|nr:hypothetical protein [Eubacteriaceae bacterium]
MRNNRNYGCSGHSGCSCPGSSQECGCQNSSQYSGCQIGQTAPITHYLCYTYDSFGQANGLTFGQPCEETDEILGYLSESDGWTAKIDFNGTQIYGTITVYGRCGCSGACESDSSVETEDGECESSSCRSSRKKAKMRDIVTLQQCMYYFATSQNVRQAAKTSRGPQLKSSPDCLPGSAGAAGGTAQLSAIEDKMRAQVGSARIRRA